MTETRTERVISSRRIPSLDGLRAISILAVVAGHMAGTAGFPSALTKLIRNPYVDFAALGVRVFFVISGFLITGLLLDEKRSRGTISLAGFYGRRTFRILPAYFAFVIAVILATRAGLIVTTATDIWHAMTFTMNYAEHRSWAVGHLWSLSVEEQFYLLWPMTVAMLSLAGARRFALATVLVVPVIRVAVSTFLPEHRDLIGTTFETSADALALGCLLAFDREQLWEKPAYRRISRWPVIVGILVLGLVLSLRYRPGILLGISVVNVGIVLGIDRAVRLWDGRLGRLLNARPMVWIGTLSYSIYLWQQVFLNRSGTAAWNRFPANIVLAFGAALASYYLVERPALRQRDRWRKYRAAAGVRRSLREPGSEPLGL